MSTVADSVAVDRAGPDSPGPILESLRAQFDDMSAQVKVAAEWVLDNAGAIAVNSMRGIASEAGVTPNTLVRMARAVGFEGYDEFRDPFRRQAADGAPSFPDRARFLQSINEGGSHGALLADMAASALGNVEALFSDIDLHELKAAADLIDASHITNVLGVGTAQYLAENFAYVAGMALDNVRAIPTKGIAIDDVARMTDADALVVMTFSPYRTETVEVASLAVDLGVPVIAVSDSHAAPIMRGAAHSFVVPNHSPYPFSSNVAATALLETLLAFVVADSTDDVVTAIDTFHANRRTAGIYI